MPCGRGRGAEVTRARRRIVEAAELLRRGDPRRFRRSMSGRSRPFAGSVHREQRAGQLDVVVLGNLHRKRTGGIDDTGGARIGELLGDGRQHSPGVESVAQADHEPAADPSDGVEVAARRQQLVDCGVDAVGDQEQGEVVGVDVAAGADLLPHVVDEGGPEPAAGLVEQDDRCRRRLAGLCQGQQLEGLVERAEASWERRTKPWDSFTSISFRVKKYFIEISFRVAVDVRVRRLLEGGGGCSRQLLAPPGLPGRRT